MCFVMLNPIFSRNWEHVIQNFRQTIVLEL